MQTIVITGASSGIGLACVEAALQAGHKVIATARKTEDLQMLQKLGAEAVALELSNESSVIAAANTIKAMGRIDVLFNNAGYGLQVAMEDATWEALEEQHTSNVIGPIIFTNLLLDNLHPGSKLIFNSSILGLITIPFRGPYCMSKHALESAADAYRLELESRGINVHVIQPGPIEAKFRSNALAKLKACLGDKQPRLDYSNHIDRLATPKLTRGTLPATACAEIFIGIVDGRKTARSYVVTGIAKKAAAAKRMLGDHFHKVARSAEPLRER